MKPSSNIKKILFVCTAIVLMVSVMLLGCSKPTPTETVPTPPKETGTTTPTKEVITLKYASFFPSAALLSKVLGEFGTTLEERSNGRIKVTYYPGGSLVGYPAMADSVTNGIVDIAFMADSATAGRYPVMETYQGVVGKPTAYASSRVANDFYWKFQPKEFDDLHVFNVSTPGPLILWSKSPIKTLEDLKGKQMRITGIMSDLIKLLGADPVGAPTAEIYDSLSKGLLDGACLAVEAGRSFKVADECKYVTNNWEVMAISCMYMVMNKNTFNSLPPDLQAIVDKTGEEWADKVALAWNQMDLDGAEYSKTQGVELIELSSEQVTRWKKAVEPYEANFIKSMVSKGFAKKEVETYIDYIKERTNYWIQKQGDLGIKSPVGPKQLRIEW